MRFLAWLICMVALFWAVAVETTDPGRLGLSLEDGRPDELHPVGSHLVPWPVYDWITLPSGIQPLSFTGGQRLTVDLPEQSFSNEPPQAGAVAFEVVVLLRVDRERAIERGNVEVLIDPANALRPRLEAHLREQLAQPRANIFQDRTWGEIGEEIAASGRELTRELGVDIVAVAIERAAPDDATQRQWEQGVVAQARAELGLDRSEPSAVP